MCPIFQLNREVSSFPNMYDMLLAKVDPLAEKFNFVQKNQKTPKFMGNFWDMLILEGAGGQTEDTRSTFMIPLKSWGYNGSN